MTKIKFDFYQNKYILQNRY